MCRSNRLVLVALTCATLGALAACGVLTAGVSVPEAFSHNNDLGLKGTIVDDRDAPLDDVLVTVKREYYLWHADASYSEYDTIYLNVNHQFDIPKRRARELTFTFHKTGYLDQNLVVTQRCIQPDNRWLQGNEWPLNTPVRMVMLPQDRPIPILPALALEVDYTDPGKLPVMDLARAVNAFGSPSFNNAALSVLPATASPPSHTLYAVIERQPVKTTGPERRIDPLDLNLPARLSLRIADPDAGFVLFAPVAGSHPLAQMTQAPESGYLPELPLSEARLRQLRDPASNLILDRNDFFYFRARGQYGKGLVSWARTNDETGPLRLFVAVQIQPDGSRNLASRTVP
jgi:hypothetical protein